MRKYQKRELIALCNTVEEALIYISDNYDNENAPIESLCGDCQQSVIAMGNVIEETEGEETSTVSLLEAFCELLYQISIETDKEALRNLTQKGKEEIREIVHSIQYDLPDSKLEILFLPYKASMWTALESIWKAADADDNCNAIVMPIPYYSLYMAEQRAELQYEGPEFPDSVPITSYKEYDIEAMRPDMIFIHNPYDDTNTLTRILDQYHSQNLKNHTDCLVYSPYGNFGAFNPVTQPFMCCTSALQYVDYVLVQSEKVKKLYNEAGVAEEKIIALGTPKTDAIVNRLKNPVKLPEEWIRKLQDRTVVLFNISLSYLVFWRTGVRNKPAADEDSWGISVVRRFVNDMKALQDYGVIWRPHPLMKTLLRSRGMQYELQFITEMEYLIDNSENMVIDKNADYTAAFQRSDAFITTYTSLIPEYMITGKPIGLYEAQYRFLWNEKQPTSYLNNYFLILPETPSRNKCQITRKEFLKRAKEGSDELKEGRLKDAAASFTNLDGTAGEKIFELLRKKLQD